VLSVKVGDVIRRFSLPLSISRKKQPVEPFMAVLYAARHVMSKPCPDKLSEARSMRTLRTLFVMALLLLSACQSTGVTRASFQAIELAARVPGEGQLVLADIGGDQHTDVLLMSRRPGRVYWFENPAWQLYQIPLMADELRAIAAHSLTDGSPASLAVAGRFTVPGSGTREQLMWLQNPGRDLTHSNWPATDVRMDVAPDALLWADLSGSGTRVLVASPELEVYTPRSARMRAWTTMSLLLESTPPISRLRAYDWDGDGRDELLAAGPAGVDVIALASRGQFVDEFLLLDAANNGGYLDVALGQSGPASQGSGVNFVATLSTSAPQLVVHRPAPESISGWRQDAVSESVSGARVLHTADLNLDGIDEIVVGGDSGLFVFYFAAQLQSWLRTVLATSGVSDLQITDLTGNGFPDIVATPAEPGALLLFQNRGRRN